MKIRLLKHILALALAVVICLPGMAAADIITYGPAVSTHSWAQAFNESGVGPFDSMEAFMISANTFEAPGFSNFSDSSWFGIQINPKYILAFGDPTTNMTFNINFIGDPSDPLKFDFLAWNVGTVVEHVGAAWDGGSWTIGAPAVADVNAYDRTFAVPLPSTVLLFGSGLAGLGFWRRRKHSRS